MITVEYNTHSTVHNLRVTGHSGSAPKGEDLICAAVTILVRTLVAMLQRRGALQSATVAEGNALIIGDTVATDGVWESFACGIELLAEQYPDYISIKINKKLGVGLTNKCSTVLQ